MTVHFHEILKASRSELVDKMARLDDLMDHLIEKAILTLDDTERVNKKDTRMDKARELLDILHSKQDKTLGTKFKSGLTKANMGYLNGHLEERALFLSASKPLIFLPC